MTKATANAAKRPTVLHSSLSSPTPSPLAVDFIMGRTRKQPFSKKPAPFDAVPTRSHQQNPRQSRLA